MRVFLWLVALMAAAIGIAVTARFNPGNVVLFYPPYRIDLSLNFFLLLQVVLFVLCLYPYVYLLVRTALAERGVQMMEAARLLDEETGELINGGGE